MKRLIFSKVQISYLYNQVYVKLATILPLFRSPNLTVCSKTISLRGIAPLKILTLLYEKTERVGLDNVK